MVKMLHSKEVSFIWDILNEIPDPEIPVISLVELGVVRGVEWVDTQLQITITPTYSGCPAMRMMEMDIDQSPYSLIIALIKFAILPKKIPGGTMLTIKSPMGKGDCFECLAYHNVAIHTPTNPP